MKKLILVATFISSLLINSCATPIAPNQNNVYNNNYQRSFRINSNIKGLTQSRDGTVYIKDVPFFQQGEDNTCGQGSMAAVLNYWDVNIDYQTVINENNPSNLPTALDQITNYMISKGLKAQDYKNSSIDYLKSLINQGKPAIVLLDFGGLNNEHYVVVTGYNERNNTILFNDSKSGPNLTIPVENFENMWENKSLANLLIFGNSFYKPIFDISK